MSEQHTVARPYADQAHAYVQAGWSCVLPVPSQAKFPPPTGFTGAEGRDTAPADIDSWAASQPGDSIALRMPMFTGPSGTLADGWCVIGIDVDAYTKGETTKHGDRTLAAKEAEWGQLPATWTSSARGPGVSGIRFYVAPAARYGTVVKAAQADGTLTGDVEIIQRHHRYAVVWPSPHAGAGDIYRWYGPDGQAVDAPPRPHELPWLPQAWVDGLAADAAALSAPSASRGEGEQLLWQLLDDHRPECADVTNARQQAEKLMSKADTGTRYDVMVGRAHNLIQLAAAGHPGAGAAFDSMREHWAQLTAGENREEEYERALLTSARKAVTTYGTEQVPSDPCLLFAGGVAYGQTPQSVYPEPQSGDPGNRGVITNAEGESVEFSMDVEPPRWASIRQVLGAHAFDPQSGLDQPLAEAVIERTYPMLRFAYDSKSWLLRAPDRWELHDDLARWAVAQVSPLMPHGDTEAEKGTPESDQAKRRARLMTNAGAGAVSSMMNALVAGGMHPAALSLSSLDADPEVMWAGGVPWSLRFSDARPVAAEHIDPNMPHLHTAPYAPRQVPTPRWDAFLESVWPDPEIRAWAVRVLSVAMTGYADRALPILLGSTGRGKTQVVALLMSVLGTYAHAANPKLLHPNSNEHDTIVFDLKGRRLSFIDEAPAEAKTGQERLKQLTGGGELTGRQMGQNSVTFAPTHTFVLTANDPPTLTDAAVRSRARLIPCEGDPTAVKQARAAIGHVTGPAWRSEAPGVLAMMMREAAAWLHDTNTASVDAAPLEIRYLAEKLGAEQDPIMVWITNETEEWPAGTGSTELYQQFTASCLRNNLRRDAIPSMSKWGRTLTSMGFPPVHTKAGNARGLRVRPQGFIEGVQAPSVTPSFVPVDATTNPSPNPSPNPSHPQASLEGWAPQGEGLTPSGEGSVNGYGQTLHPAYPQVNPPVSISGEGYEGYVDPLRAQETPPINEMWADLGNASTLHREPASATPASPPQQVAPAKPKRESAKTPRPCAECGGTLGVRGEHDADCATGAAQAEKNAVAKAKRAEVAETKRLEAIAAASGAQVGLPAVVTRDGSVRAVSLEQADALLATITGPAGHGELTVDVEHTGYPIGHRHYALRTVQLGDETFAVVLDAADGPSQVLATDHLTAARTLHAHSAAADIVPLAVAGLVNAEQAWDRMIDTGTLAKIADPASTGNSDDLKGLAKAILPQHGLEPVAHAADQARSALFKAGKWKTDIEVTHPVEESGWAQVDHRSETMARYDGADVLDCAAIARRLPALAPEQLHRERTAQKMTARVAHTGFRFVPEQIDRLHDEHSATKTALARLIPVENPGSNDQLGAVLTAMGAPLPPTGTGKPSVAKSVLEPLAGARGSDRTWAAEATSEVQQMARLILDWRHADTALKLFLDPWRDMVRNGDGRARSTVHTLGADTGRMSSVRFNLQQISREGGMRACISADPGFKLITADFSSVEVRVAAALSQDQHLIQMLADGVDLHAEIAKLVWGPGFTKANRYLAKRKVFGRIYGQGVDGMARTDGAGVEVAKQVIAAMDALTPGLTAWSADIRGAVEAGRTQYPTYAGRVIHMPKNAAHAAGNYAVQGSARELLVDALMRWAETPWGGCTLMPVHDEILAMVPEAEADEATEVLKACMATELYGVPIVAEADEPSFEWRDSA